MSDTIAKPARVSDAENDPASELIDQLQPGDNVPAPTTGTDLMIYDYEGYEGKGLEGVTLEDQVMPFLVILQSLSPQVVRSKPEYNPDARPGMILNKATSELYDGDEGIEVIPVWWEPVYTEWIPRTDITFPNGKTIRGGGGEGGFRGVHKQESQIIRAARSEAYKNFGRDNANRMPLPHRNERNEDTVLIQQRNLGVIYGTTPLDPANVRRAMIVFTSTKIPVFRRFISLADGIRYEGPKGIFKPALFTHRYRFRTVPQTNKKGDFYNWRIDPAEPLPTLHSLIKRTDPLFIMADEFYEQWASGGVEIDYETEGSTTVSGGDGGSGNAFDADEIPFITCDISAEPYLKKWYKQIV